MTLAVDPDWWKTLFDEVYLVTDARTVQGRGPDPAGSRRLLRPGSHGAGGSCPRSVRRSGASCHRVDTARRRCLHGAGLFAGAAGRREPERAQHNLPVTFVQGDARQTPLAGAAFDVVLILGNSLGYSAEEDADLNILTESRRLLAPAAGCCSTSRMAVPCDKT